MASHFDLCAPVRCDVLFGAETGSPWTVFVNSLQLKVAYVIRYDNGTLAAYVDGTVFLKDDFAIRDANTRDLIARLYRNKLTLKAPRWEITVNMTDHPVANPVLLGLLVGQRTFDPKNKKTDVCNSFFVTSGYIVLVGVVFVFGYIPGSYAYKAWQKRHRTHSTYECVCVCFVQQFVLPTAVT